MDINFTEKDRQDIEEKAQHLSLTKEEYLLNLHQKNSVTKTSLKDWEKFRDFIDDYHHMLDNLYEYNYKIQDLIEANHDTKVIDAILHFLDTTVKNPMILTQIYNIYKEQNEEPPSDF